MREVRAMTAACSDVMMMNARAQKRRTIAFEKNGCGFRVSQGTGSHLHNGGRRADDYDALACDDQLPQRVEVLEAPEQAGCQADVVGCRRVQKRFVVPVCVAVGVYDCACNWQLESGAAGRKGPFVYVEEDGVNPRASGFKDWRERGEGDIRVGGQEEGAAAAHTLGL